MKLKFSFGNILFAYHHSMLWWGKVSNVTMHIDGRILQFDAYVKIVKKL